MKSRRTFTLFTCCITNSVFLRSNAVVGVRQISESSGSRGLSRENSGEGHRNVPPSTKPDSSRRPSDVLGNVAVAVKQLSRDEWETKMKGIVEEFLNNRDVKVS